MKSVITCDMEGRVLTMNDDAVKIFGYKKEEIIGKKRVSIFSPGEIVIQNVGNWLATADKLGEFVGKTYFLKKDGTKINAKISIRPTFADGKSNAQTGYCGVTEVIDEDVTVPINLSTKIIKGVAITRVPFTSASIFPMLAIAAYYAGLGDGLFSVTSLLLAVFGVLLLHLSSNVFNDYFDVSDGTDEANNEYFQPGGAAITGGSRAIELGIITLNKTKTVAISLLLASLLVAGFLFYNIYQVTGATSNVEGALAVGLSGLFLGYFYTARPLRLVSRRGLGELAIFLSFGPLMTLGALLAISSSTIELFSDQFYIALLLGIPHGLLTTNILYINQYPDTISDASTGKNHLIVTFGKKNARWGYLFILSAAFISSILLIPYLENNISSFNKNIFIIGNIVLFAYGLIAFINLYKNYDKRELIHSNLKTIYLQIFYGLFTVVVFNLFFI